MSKTVLAFKYENCYMLGVKKRIAVIVNYLELTDAC